jgi:hypothetical protein
MKLQTWDGGFRVDAESEAERQVLRMFLGGLLALHTVEVDHRRLPGPLLAEPDDTQPIAGIDEGRPYRI